MVFCHHVTVSPCHRVTVSPCHRVTVSPRHRCATASPCHRVTLSPCHLPNLVTEKGSWNGKSLPQTWPHRELYGRGLYLQALQKAGA